jgi:hypothetical protein
MSREDVTVAFIKGKNLRFFWQAEKIGCLFGNATELCARSCFKRARLMIFSRKALHLAARKRINICLSPDQVISMANSEGHSLFGLDGNTSFISYYRISSRLLLPGRLKCSTIGSMNDAGSP